MNIEKHIESMYNEQNASGEQLFYRFSNISEWFEGENKGRHTQMEEVREKKENSQKGITQWNFWEDLGTSSQVKRKSVWKLDYFETWFKKRDDSEN